MTKFFIFRLFFFFNFYFSVTIFTKFATAQKTQMQHTSTLRDEKKARYRQQTKLITRVKTNEQNLATFSK